jgi:hypothetical protein
MKRVSIYYSVLIDRRDFVRRRGGGHFSILGRNDCSILKSIRRILGHFCILKESLLDMYSECFQFSNYKIKCSFVGSC